MAPIRREAYGFDAARLDKRQALIDAGDEPYPCRFDGARSVAALRRQIEDLQGADDGIEGTVRLAGRLWARRDMGRTVFADLRDGSGKMQLCFVRRRLSAEAWQRLGRLDVGDLLGVEGTVCRTRTGEWTVMVDDFWPLAKSVVAVPLGKEAGGQVFSRQADPEARYRERHLTWMLDEGARRRMVLRAGVIAALRAELQEAGFLEVDTPVLTPLYGGAEARPFRTSAWALGGSELFLRISPELHLKRYLVAGFERVFTLCSNFRNEGIDRSHNPEFCMLEWYEAYSDYRDQLDRFEQLVAAVCQAVHGTTRVEYQGTELDFAPPWRRVTVLEALQQEVGIDAGALEAAALRDELARRGLEAEGLCWGQAVARLFEACCEGHLVQPTFVLDHPLAISPLTRRHRQDGRLAERFEPYVCGMELGNAYSELNDPVEQAARLEAQQGGRRDPEYRDHPVDVDFIRALGCGMPPAGGVGLGVDRLVMLLTDAASIREVVAFPMVRGRGEEGGGS